MGRNILIGHPTGNANVRGAIASIAAAGFDPVFHTAINTRVLTTKRFLPAKARRALIRRSFDLRDARSHPWWELLLRAGGPLGYDGLHAVYDRMDRALSHLVTAEDFAVYLYEDGAMRTFERARDLGVPTVYDLPMPYWRLKHRLLEEEAERNPAWAPLLGGLTDRPEILDRKDAELDLASIVVSASPLTTRSVIESAPRKHVVQIEYGCPPAQAAVSRRRSARLQVLYVGGLTQRKGLSYLFDAMRAARSFADLTLVGRTPASPPGALARELQHHRHHESLPPAEVLEVMRRSDVLVLPSIVEGFGLVIAEALSQGIPVLATDRTGLPGLLDGAADEWILPAGQSAPILAMLERFQSSSEALLDAKEISLQIARGRTWQGYRARLAEVLLGLSSSTS